MELTHSFTVPASKEETWAALNDIESVAQCFPGATVTSADGDSFEGSVKVKLGPVALLYNGSGTFTSKDEAAGTMAIDANGKDKRGNGTAGAKVTVQLGEEGEETKVDVTTDLQITGKPAQFGRGMIQGVSDKLLAKFVECLQSKVGAPEATDEPAAPDEATVPAAAAAPESPAGAAATADTADSAPSGDVAAASGEGAESAADQPAAAAAPLRPAPPPRSSTTTSASGSEDDALDLGAAVLPVLLKTYGKQIGIGVGVLVVLAFLRRVLSRG